MERVNGAAILVAYSPAKAALKKREVVTFTALEHVELRQRLAQSGVFVECQPSLLPM